MVKAGDNIRLSSMKGPDREGVVIAVMGSLLTVRWPSQEETTLVPAPGTLTVLATGEAGSKTAAKKKGAAKTPAGAKKPTAGKTATPEMAREAHALIKGIYPVERLLYGGSVKPENAEELLSQDDVDGALVGGASLEVDSFTAICETAARLTRS